jgi:hypothetical protein
MLQHECLRLLCCGFSSLESIKTALCDTNSLTSLAGHRPELLYGYSRSVHFKVNLKFKLLLNLKPMRGINTE